MKKYVKSSANEYEVADALERLKVAESEIVDVLNVLESIVGDDNSNYLQIATDLTYGLADLKAMLKGIQK